MSSFILKGYEDYDIKILRSKFFHNKRGENFINHWYQDPNHLLKNIRLLDKNDPLVNYQESIIEMYVEPRLTTPNKGSKLYYDSFCKMPKRMGTMSYNRVRDQFKAECIVIPTHDLEYIKKHAVIHRNYAIFKHPTNSTLLLLDTSEIDTPFKEGQSIEDWIKENPTYVHKDSLEEAKEKYQFDLWKKSYCVHKSPVCFYHPSLEYIFKIIEGEYKIFTFDIEIYKSVISQYGVIPTIDTVHSIITMLQSDNIVSQKNGVQMLTALNYTDYPHVIAYVINAVRSTIFSEVQTTAYRYIRNHIDSLEIYPPYDFSNVTEKEIDVCKDLLIEKITEEIERVIKANKIVSDIPFNVTYKIE